MIISDLEPHKVCVELESGVKLNYHHHKTRSLIAGYHNWVFIGQTSIMQNLLLHVGQGHFELSQVSGFFWSCLDANHLPMQPLHHIGRQAQFTQFSSSPPGGLPPSPSSEPSLSCPFSPSPKKNIPCSRL